MAEHKGRRAATIKRGAECLVVRYNNFKIFSQCGSECITWLREYKELQVENRVDRYVIHVLSFIQYLNMYYVFYQCFEGTQAAWMGPRDCNNWI